MRWTSLWSYARRGVALLTSMALMTAAQAAVVPGKGAADTLDIASWNIEWFGDAGNGPGNEPLQLQNARDVISGTDMDIWGVAEVVGTSQFNSLKSQLAGYAGFLANDPTVVNGSAYYAGTEQKVGILYKSSVASVRDARVILTGSDNDFAGRPPLQVTLRVTLNGRTEDIVVIVMHAKCCADSASWTRRANAANALKTYLDANFPSQKVWVIGDFNDDLDASITVGSPTPYANILSDTARYRFPTKALSDAHIASTVDFPDTIDHHLASDEAHAQLLAGSVQVHRVDQFIANYGNSTSDHYPVLSRYSWASGTQGLSVTSPNGGESWLGGSTHGVTWNAVGIGNVKIEYTVNGSTWNTLTASTPASGGTYAWTLPSVVSAVAAVRVSDAANGAMLDTSDGTFSIVAGGAPAQVILNEVGANEPGSHVDGEFVEIVNIGGTAVDMGGWTLSDASGVRHTFASGTSLQAGKAIAVFGGASGVPTGLANAATASTGTLGLGNSGDTVTLKNHFGTVIQTMTYSSALAGTDGVSINRNPDGGAAGVWVKHDAMGGLARSAGLKASGLAW